MDKFRVALVGCGYVADFYARTIANHSELQVVAVCDILPERAAALAAFLSVPAFSNLESLLAASADVQLIVNLTPPECHSQISEQCLRAGKHVYSEKPFAESVARGKALLALAESLQLGLASAPCTVLGEHAQSLWREIRKGSIGAPRLVYAEMDDGAIHQMAHEFWFNSHGVPWPAASEMATGCIAEHAAYPLSWLVSFFGPAQSVTAFSSTLIEEKGPGSMAGFPAPPDFSVAALTFGEGIAARLTCGVIAARDRRFCVFGEEGALTVEDCWNFHSPVYLSRKNARSQNRENSAKYLSEPERLPELQGPSFSHHCGDPNDIDYARGIAEFASALREGRPCRLDGSMALHILEIEDHMYSPRPATAFPLTTTLLHRSAPMPWCTE